MTIRTWLWCVLAAISLAAGASRPSPGRRTDVGSITSHPRRYQTLRVKIRAEVIASVHGTALVDARCPRRAVALREFRHHRSQAGFVELDHVLFHDGLLGGTDKRVFATVTGRFLRNGKDPDTHRRGMILQAERVERIKVRRLKR